MGVGHVRRPQHQPVRKDKSCGNNTITLWDGEKEQTFDKGIGTHAASRIVYDVSDLGAIRFERTSAWTAS